MNSVLDLMNVINGIIFIPLRWGKSGNKRCCFGRGRGHNSWLIHNFGSDSALFMIRMRKAYTINY